MTVEEFIVQLSAVKDLKSEVYIAHYNNNKLNEFYPVLHLSEKIIHEWSGENCIKQRKIFVIS